MSEQAPAFEVDYLRISADEKGFVQHKMYLLTHADVSSDARVRGHRAVVRQELLVQVQCPGAGHDGEHPAPHAAGDLPGPQSAASLQLSPRPEEMKQSLDFIIQLLCVILLVGCLQGAWTAIIIIQNNNKIISMPAFSIGKASKDPSFVYHSNTPGVGAYQTNSWNKVSRIRTSPSSSMTKTRKFFDPVEKDQIKVGPGSYDPAIPKSSIMVSMKGKPGVDFKSESPSPGNYNVQIKFNTKHYSFARSCRKFKTEEGPGPGDYSANLGNHTVCAVIGKQPRDRMNTEHMPGPGAYQVECHSPKGEGEKFTFPREKKFMLEEAEEKNKKEIPGPGAYSISDFKKRFRGGKFTYAERLSINENSQVPGPASYSPKSSTVKNAPHVVIGNQKRQTFKTDQLPGPGAYEIPKPQVFKKKDGIAVFTHSDRMRDVGPQTPGPGYYNSKAMHESRAHSITSRHQIVSKQKKPGPQSYNPEINYVKTKAGRPVIGSEGRMRKLKTQTPGPGQYKFQEKTYSKTFYFSKAKKAEKMNSTVGPGQYKLKPFLGICDGLQHEAKQILYV